MLRFLFVLILFTRARSLTDQEVRHNFGKIILKCSVEYPLQLSEILKLQQLQPPKTTQAKCLLMCAYKKLRILTDKGVVDKEASYRITEVIAVGDKQRLDNGKKLVDVCLRVNNETVADGEKGCDRAGLVFNCLVEEAPKFGFDVKAQKL